MEAKRSSCSPFQEVRPVVSASVFGCVTCDDLMTPLVHIQKVNSASPLQWASQVPPVSEGVSLINTHLLSGGSFLWVGMPQSQYCTHLFKPDPAQPLLEVLRTFQVPLETPAVSSELPGECLTPYVVKLFTPQCALLVSSL